MRPQQGNNNKLFEEGDHASSYADHRPAYEGSGLKEKIAEYVDVNSQVCEKC